MLFWAGYGWSMDNNSDFPRPFHGGFNPPSFIPPYEPTYQFRRRQRYNKHTFLIKFYRIITSNVFKIAIK